jgi:predicted cupin superfamily sugar epimerase
MNPRARSLIADLDLQPHPERSALTAFYFLLLAGQHSGWHQVR